RPAPPDPEPAESPRPRVFAACAVIGCLGVCLVAAVGFLAYGVILILNHLGERVADPDRPAAVGGAGGAGVGPIRPTTLRTPAATVEVGGEFDAVCRAAGGRYLLFRIPSEKRIVAFDANTGAMVTGFEVGLSEPGSLLAAGAAKLWVYKPKVHEVVRVDLLTGQVEQRAPAPKDAEGKVDAVAAGAGSAGPFYLVAGKPARTDIWMLDGADLSQAGFVQFRDGVGAGVRVRASDDGGLLAVSGRLGAAAVRSDPGRATFHRVGSTDDRLTLAAPAPDGRYVYTPRGVFTPGGERFLRVDRDDPAYTLPAAHGGDVYLSLGVSAGGFLTGPPEVHPAGSRTVLGALDDVTVPRRLGAADTGDVPPDQRVYYWPGAGLAAVLPTDNKTVRLWKVDLPAPKGGRGE
ncbi:MAG: hypothetical protein K2X87_11620, partial [Gemmataceae bacterium]|nr:hypothetical protein [Gemmataceae bacterium]